MIIKVSKTENNDYDGVSHGVKCSQEDDRIPPLESREQSLDQEHRLSCVFRGCSDASASFLDQLNGRLVPGASSLNCHWKRCERKTARQTLQSCSLLRCCLVSSRACFSGCLVYVRLGVGFRNCYCLYIIIGL